jgi:uncharacterized membrane protein required for colicin V production
MTVSRSGTRLPVWLLLLGCFGAIVGFSWSEKDYVAAAALAVMGVCGLWGYLLGAVRLVGVLASLGAVYRFTPPTARWLAPQIVDWFSTSMATTRLISWGIASLAMVVLITLAAALLSRWLIQKRPGLAAGNQIVGFGFGAVEGAMVMLVLLGGAVSAAPLASERLKTPVHSSENQLSRAVARQVVELAQQTRQSTLGAIVIRYNPFAHIPQLRHFQRTVAVIQQPHKLRAISEHPALTRLQKKPSVQAALQAIANDAELRELLSGKRVDTQIAFSLLQNPTITKLLEQPELVDDITQAISEIDTDLLSSLDATAPQSIERRLAQRDCEAAQNTLRETLCKPRAEP